MSDYYHHFLSSMTGIGGHPPPNPQEVTTSMPQPPGMSLGGPPLSNPYQSLGYFTGFPEPLMFNAPKSQRSRRKSAPGLDHVKHRRTRSGCYTCRSRRVKCDETHPVCERCRKGKRECVYPDPPAPKGSSSQGSKDASGQSQHTSPTSSPTEDEDDMDQDSKLEPIADVDEEREERSPTSHQVAPMFPPPRRSSTTSFPSLQRVTSRPRQGSETPSLESSPSMSTAPAGSFSIGSLAFSDTQFQSGSRADWSFLPQELQFYLNYFCENITHYHYCMVQDSNDFFRSILPSIALRNEALLYAVVGFAAYHHTLKNPNGQISQFLQYYNRSVTLLLGFLKKKERHNIGTLLTILQLATIEEYLGDWVNLMGHQRAASEVLLQLLTPLSAMQSATSRMILTWYTRFDVFVGTMGSFGTTLPREWFSNLVDYYRAQIAAEPDNLALKFEECSARLRLISVDMSIFFGKVAKSDVAGDDHIAEHERLATELQEWKDDWDPALTDPSHMVTEFSTERPAEQDDIVDPFELGILFDRPHFASTILTCEWHSAVIILQSQAALRAEGAQPVDLAEHAYAIFQIFEAIELWPSAPNGSLITIQAGLALGALFVPQTERNHRWIRKKFATLELMGYIFPLTMRMRMAELFDDQSCVAWWLPDDEGFTPVLKSIRMFADERNATAVTAQTERLREMRHGFTDMQLSGRSDSEADR